MSQQTCHLSQVSTLTHNDLDFRETLKGIASTKHCNRDPNIRHLKHHKRKHCPNCKSRIDCSACLRLGFFYGWILVFMFKLLAWVRHSKAFTIEVKVVHACVLGGSVQAGRACCVYALLCYAAMPSLQITNKVALWTLCVDSIRIRAVFCRSVIQRPVQGPESANCGHPVWRQAVCGCGCTRRLRQRHIAR